MKMRTLSNQNSAEQMFKELKDKLYEERDQLEQQVEDLRQEATLRNQKQETKMEEALESLQEVRQKLL